MDPFRCKCIKSSLALSRLTLRKWSKMCSYCKNLGLAMIKKNTNASCALERCSRHVYPLGRHVYPLGRHVDLPCIPCGPPCIPPGSPCVPPGSPGWPKPPLEVQIVYFISKHLKSLDAQRAPYGPLKRHSGMARCNPIVGKRVSRL